MSIYEVVSLVYSELIKISGPLAVVWVGLLTLVGNRIANKEAQRRETGLANLKASFDVHSLELKARLDTSVHRTVLVDKVQFEHEYQIYKEAWGYLFALKQATLKLRPMFDSIDPNESKEARKERRLGALREPFDKALEHIEKHKPFFPQEVHTSMAAVLDKCYGEFIDYQYLEPTDKEYWKEAGKNRDELIQLIEAACTSIRERIAAVRVG